MSNHLPLAAQNISHSSIKKIKIKKSATRIVKLQRIQADLEAKKKRLVQTIEQRCQSQLQEKVRGLALFI